MELVVLPVLLRLAELVLPLPEVLQPSSLAAAGC